MWNSWTLSGGVNRQWADVGVSMKPIASQGSVELYGSLASLASNCTAVLSGVCNDFANVLSLTQSNSKSKGPVLNITSSGLGAMLNLSGASHGSAAAIFNQTSTTQDIFTASASGTTRFTINNAGNTFTTVRSTSTFALCHPTNGAGYQEITDCSGSVGADYAEMYPTEGNVDYGDIVTAGPTLQP